MAKDCSECRSHECYDGRDCFGQSDRAIAGYSSKEVRSMRVSGRIEAEHYMKMTRLQEIVLYAKRMGMRRLGIAFCIGLSKEARTVARFLKSEGFEVSSACCKICGIDKKELGVKRMHGTKGVEAVCNPLGQAMRLNDRRTEMNLVIGLCIGHDMLFTEHSEAPVTTLIVKDRVLAHNPAGAVYSAYYLENRSALVPD